MRYWSWLDCAFWLLWKWSRSGQRLAEVRKRSIIKGLRPDGKSQVTVEYDGDKPARVHTVLIAAQHEPDVSLEKLKKEIIDIQNDFDEFPRLIDVYNPTIFHFSNIFP